MSICLDNMILIWGIRCFSSPGQEEMIGCARQFLADLDRDKVIAIIPAPVLGEYLTGTELQDLDPVYREFESKFVVSPYDGLAAAKCAEIWLKLNGGRTMSSELQLKGFGRQELKTDCMIVAIAATKRCDAIYSDDPHIQAVAAAIGIPCRELPPLSPTIPPLQLTMGDGPPLKATLEDRRQGRQPKRRG